MDYSRHWHWYASASCFFVSAFPLPLNLAGEMASTPLIFALLASFCAQAHAALVNRTIDDSSPLVQYDCEVVHCDTTTTMGESLLCSAVNGANRPFTIIGFNCTVLVPFTGTAVYAFLSCTPDAQCEFEIDKTGPHASIRAADNSTDTGLSYFNDSLLNGTHMLSISTSHISLFDSAIYTFDDGVTQPSTISASSSSTTSTSSPSPTSVLPGKPNKSSTTSNSSPSPTSVLPGKPNKSKPAIGPIVGGVLGGLLLLAILVALLAMRRGRSLWRISAYPPPDVEAAGRPPKAPESPTLTDQIRVLQAQTAELQLALAARGAPGAAAMKGGGDQPPVQAVPAVEEDLLLYMDSGLRSEPARQVEELPPEYFA
ncbi:hypothetical protein B0H17DRAFT_1337153 [Mycena rosella]|uniref:Mid2 domain-containing protein n=1 Tax=Mycena rosella TaxID=1033263 RepID=A0AAD7CSN1_MYCRO|nr:hypothetical protein B0H17DRAFT_1337153 [Mycena rosella]